MKQEHSQEKLEWTQWHTWGKDMLKSYLLPRDKVMWLYVVDSITSIHMFIIKFMLITSQVAVDEVSK